MKSDCIHYSKNIFQMQPNKNRSMSLIGEKLVDLTDSKCKEFLVFLILK